MHYIFKKRRVAFVAVSIVSTDLSVVLYTYMCVGVHVYGLPVFPKNVKMLFRIPQFFMCSFD